MPLNNSVFDALSRNTSALDLIGVRRLFIEAVGCYDLIKDGNTDLCVDDGADVFIRAGQDYLDERGLGPGVKAKYFKRLSIGDYYTLVRFVSLDFIHFVSSEGVTDVTDSRVSERTMLACGPASEWINGTPSSWAYLTSRLAPDNEEISTTELDDGGVVDYAPVIFDPADKHSGIIWNPPVETEMTLRLGGHFYSAQLSLDTDKSWWTVYKPLLLVLAAGRQREFFNRNRQGVMDYDSAIEAELQRLDDTMVEREVSGIGGEYVY